MNAGYRFALFLHFGALLAAIATSSLVHFAHGHMHRAAIAGEARRWHGFILRASVVFPMTLVVLLATGAYMVRTAWTWNQGWVIAGLVGIAFLLLNGIRLGRRGGALMKDLVALGDSPPHALLAGRTDAAFAWANTGVATAVVFAMSMKPSLPWSLTALAVGAATGFAIGLRPVKSAAGSGASAQPEARRKRS